LIEPKPGRKEDTMTTLRFVAIWLAAGVVLTADRPVARAVADDQPVSFDLLVPADAQVVIDGNPTRSTGEWRRYVPPPLPAGKDYTYTLKVTSQGKTVTRTVTVRAGSSNSFDLRPEFQAATAAAAPPPREAVPTPAGGRAGQDKPDPLPSWNDGAAKRAILEFVRATTDQASPQYVPPEQRVATFDQDGTLWVEHPMYTQVIYCLERVRVVAAQKPELKDVEPFKTVLSGNREAIAKLSLKDLEEVLAATLSGMTVEEFGAEVTKWLATAKHPRWDRPYTDLTYLPMLEVMRYLRAHGYKTYIVTGGGQDFVRAYAERVYGIPPEQVVGTAGGT